jgi:hypothetical protein
MRPVGIDLAKLIAGEKLPDDFEPDCPGARLRVTRQDYDDLVRGGEHFQTARQDMPFDGYGDARVRCSMQVAPMVNTASKSRLHYGLCHSCSGLEADNRANLRERAKVRGDR